MKLKKIEIFGFKSFADKVLLDFHEGVTCIVGPNGCGKSNIADAIRWVFGEQSAKSMRCGSKMADVIFAGTATRKSLGYAEVTVTFSEVNGALPIDYEEVAVTRKLHRSGESEYFINRQNVRLKDIQDIFLDTGIGRSALSIFEQGKIDQVIYYSPVERRTIFEEVAGIGRYLMRKKESLRKFVEVDQNLTRIKDIVSLLEKQIAVLEEQAEKAKTYQEESHKLEILEKSILFEKIKQLKAKEERLSLEKASYQQNLISLKKETQQTEQQIKDLKAILEKVEGQYFQKTENLHLKRGERRSLKERASSNQERHQNLLERQNECQKEQEAIQNKIVHWNQEMHDLHANKETLDQELLKKRELYKVREKLFQTVEKELTSLRDKQLKGHQDQVGQIQKEKGMESELSAHKIRLENHEEKKSHLEERQGHLKHIIADLQSQEEKRKNELNQSKLKVDHLKQTLASLEEQLKSCNAKWHSLNEEAGDLQRKQQEIWARKNALERLREDNEGFSEGSKKLLKESSNPKSPLFGLIKRLYEQFSVEKGYESALSMALKAYSETLVVEKRADLETVLSYAKEKKIRDFSLICKEHLLSYSGKGQKNSLYSKVSSTPLTEHFLKEIFLLDKFEEAFNPQQGTLECVTKDQLFVDHFGVIHCGFSEKKSSFLREGEIKELASELQVLEKKFEEQREKQEQTKNQKNELQETRNLQDKKVREAEMKLVETNFSYRRLVADLEKTKTESDQVSQEIQNSHLMIDQIKKTQKELNAKLLEIKSLSVKSQEQNKAAEDSLRLKLEERESRFKELQEIEKEVNLVTDECRKIGHALNLLEVKKMESLNSCKKLEEESHKNTQLIKHLAEETTNQISRSEGLEKMLLTEELQTKELAEELKNRKENLSKLEESYKTDFKKVQEEESKFHRLEVAFAEATTSKNALEEELKLRFELTFDEKNAAAFPFSEPLEKVEKEVKRLRQKQTLENDINFAAIEDYEKQKCQKDELKMQMDDLEISKSELEHLMAKMDEESRKLFSEAFQKVRENFKKNFTILFNGGEADLELLDSQEILEAGIEIIAKPPGKKMRSLSLLSGGEKCLTAMALLFSIFEVKAAPFCILDEIDAPLDDSNIERFVDVVKQFIDRSQFIIITHNKRTMAIGDRLYGVSMQEKGVSKLLTMEFSKGNKKTLELSQI